MNQTILFLLYAYLNLAFVPLHEAQGAMEGHQTTNRATSWSVLTEFEFFPSLPFLPVYKPIYDVAIGTYDWIWSILNEEPYDGDCGQQADRYQQDLYPNTRLIGGSVAKPHSWPWQVQLIYDLGGGRIGRCGGSLVRAKPKDTKTATILTAAHCVTRNVSGETVKGDPKRLTVVTGQHHRSSWFEYGRKYLPVAEIIPFKGFNLRTRRNDIALVKLATPVTFNIKIRPICLPEQGAPVPVDNQKCAVTGWGVADNSTWKASKKLKQVKMNIFEHFDQCKLGPKVFGGSWDTNIQNEIICAASPIGQHKENACVGDSGGPLVCFVDDKWTLFGIVSFGADRCLGSTPGIFARVSNYVHWILQNPAD